MSLCSSSSKERVIRCSEGWVDLVLISDDVCSDYILSGMLMLLSFFCADPTSNNIKLNPKGAYSVFIFLGSTDDKDQQICMSVFF